MSPAFALGQNYEGQIDLYPLQYNGQILDVIEKPETAFVKNTKNKLAFTKSTKPKVSYGMANKPKTVYNKQNKQPLHYEVIA